MLEALRSRLTYANVAATVALFLALGGGAYALSGIPDRGGVFHGCVNDKTGALRVVKSESACRKARRRGRKRIPGESAITWSQRGQQGLQGVPGLNGTPGTPGAPGQTGAAGPSDVHIVGGGSVALSTSAPTDVLSLTVPAGSYLLGAELTAFGNSSVGCSLTDGTTVWGASSMKPTDPSGRDNLSIAGADTFSGPKTVKLNCVEVGSAVNAFNPRLWAIKTGDLHATLPLPAE